MTYTPYNNDSSCKTADQVSSDVAGIAAKGFTTLRLYATDCSGPQNIGSAAKAHNMNLILGVYIDNTGIGSNTDAQVSALLSWGSGNWGMVEMVVFGNEALFNGWTTASALASALSSTRSKFRAAGYNGPVTTCDTVDSINYNSKTLCPVMDVVTANIHPFFAEVSASSAGDFVTQQLSNLAGYCGNTMPAYNLETGWPSQGNANGAAVPSSDNQKTAISSILSAAGPNSVMFSYSNDMWKAPGNLDVEQYWGCAQLFRNN
ncbi:glycoside hydrolase family 17 protein [Baudoinia panamericana UAMH 10762]|uniref:Probable beta-glucosidase btgE n=1 Tax=Baudoinia panamericana (strain UAMH 10762) TaxID=717646 RepID=M2MUP8_BAUPA|nr:glycoside hydrolase family 17 protein [Baudoinia panamericana UAMH 10762]EMC95298.1 glycoside hydrolase family 17 protein [Baudoinia panamericana UAMH 10762]